MVRQQALTKKTTVKSFKDLTINKPTQAHFTGNKIKIKKILNLPIVVHDYKIGPSKYDGNCLQMQISLNDTKHVVFTGSKNLMDIIQQVQPQDLPFTATITQDDNEMFHFN